MWEILLSVFLALVSAQETRPAEVDKEISRFLGSWAMSTEIEGRKIPATLTLVWQEGNLKGTWQNQGRTMELSHIEISGVSLRFQRQMSPDSSLSFTGKLDGERIQGKYSGPFGELACSGARAQPGAGSRQKLHDRPIVEKDGKVLVWAKEDENTGKTEYFDLTGALIDPYELQYGVGKDSIRSIDEPQFVNPSDPRLAAAGIQDDTEVIGVELGGESKAYPVFVMSRHEVVNDIFAGQPYAVLW